MVASQVKWSHYDTQLYNGVAPGFPHIVTMVQAALSYCTGDGNHCCKDWDVAVLRGMYTAINTELFSSCAAASHGPRPTSSKKEFGVQQRIRKQLSYRGSGEETNLTTLI